MNPYLYLKTDHPTDGEPMVWRAYVTGLSIPPLSIMVGVPMSRPSMYRIKQWKEDMQTKGVGAIRLAPLSVADGKDDTGDRTVHCGYGGNPNPRHFLINGKRYEEIVVRQYGNGAASFSCNAYGVEVTPAAQDRLESLYGETVAAFIREHSANLLERHVRHQIDQLIADAQKVQWQCVDLVAALYRAATP